MEKPKVLILQKIISNYRIPLFNILNEKYDITLGIIENNIQHPKINFKIFKIDFHNFSNIYLPTKCFINTCNNYDIVVMMCDLHFLNFCILPFLNLKPKIVSWSIGIRASYKIKYNISRKKTFLDLVYGQVLKKCDANIFYYDFPIDFWKNILNKKQVFTAFNTLEVPNSKISYSRKKDTIIYVGSLISGKGIEKLLNSYQKNYSELSKSGIKLKIIGNGPKKDEIVDFIETYKMKKFVQLYDQTFDLKKLESHFERAICFVSPYQAGLSVFLSFAFGVPFITKEDSITGVERKNIINNFNGILYENDSDLDEILKKCITNQAFFSNLGKNGYNFYQEKAKINHMVEGFEGALNYVSKL